MNRWLAIGLVLLLLAGAVFVFRPGRLKPTPYPTYTPLPSHTPYPTFTPLPSHTPYPTYTPYATYTRVPNPTATPRPSPTPAPPPELGEHEQRIVGLSTKVLLAAMIAIPVILAVGTLLNATSRKQALETTQSILKGKFVFSTSIGFSIVLLLFGLLALILERSLQIAGFAWLVAWLIASEDLYPGITEPETHWVDRAKPLLILAAVYVLSWSGFMVVGYTRSVVGTLLIYLVGIILYKGANRKQFNAVLRVRLADDLFLMIVTLIVFMSTLYLVRESKSASLLGAAVDNFFWNVYEWRIDPLLVLWTRS
jgi:uncharacterized membrane protein